MLTTISKCLAVFTVVASLLFLGVAVVSTAAGHNWAGDIEELPEFVFTKTISETGVTWGGKSRTDETFSKSGILPEVVVGARKELQTAQKERIEELDRQIQAVTTQLATEKQIIEIDLKAIETRIKQLETDLTAIEEQVVAKTTEAAKLAEDISQVQADTVTRRDEGIRLKAKLKEIRADKYRADEQKKRLIDLLARITGNIDRVERRNQQLRKRLNKPEKPPYDVKPPAKGGV